VWYRTSEGCPDGEAFVSRLSELGKTARLARVGDRVDFVVTLGSGPSESSGRLERQTRGGTVAIREYRDARCEQVAEALALTLDLALEPDGARRADASTSPSIATPARDEPLRATAAREMPAPAAAADDAAADDAAGPAPGESSSPVAALALGVQATIATGIAPGILPGGALFIDGRLAAAAPASWRGSLFGAYRESTAREREIELLLVGGRVEGCAFELRRGPITVSPCLGLDAGLLRATGPSSLGVTDVGFWSAAAAHGRFAAALGEGVSFELQVGGLVPLVRYEMGPGEAAWFRTRAVGFAASAGAAWQIP
jgi:hypothetical protein